MVGTFPPTPATETEAEAPLSNCLLLQLSGILGGKAGVQAALAIASLRQELESCGDIAQVEHCPGRGPDGTAMLVTFWDRRSAGSAKEAFGSACSYEPQADSCTATLTRDSLAHLKGCEVSKTTELGDDLLEVEFFDSRTAAAAIAMSATCSTLASLAEVGSGCDLASVETASDGDRESVSESGGAPSPAGAEAQAAAARLEPMYLPTGEGPGLAQESTESSAAPAARSPAAVGAEVPEPAAGPACLRPKFLRGEEGLGLSQLSWGALQRRQEWRTELRVRGLPPRLCDRESLHELLVQLGLRDVVVSVQVPDAAKSKGGWAFLQARSVTDVPRIAKAFHGRMFRGSRVPVAVSFADGSGLSGGSRGQPAKLAGEPLRVGRAAAAAEELAPPPGLPRPGC
mmetsp:Transcript_49815/g.138962  ORF Transcript_49815/g.138962 Transcript_49815/m.138962 type:complete len:400 (+) Transcript_49815:101-1300(+)